VLDHQAISLHGSLRSEKARKDGRGNETARDAASKRREGMEYLEHVDYQPGQDNIREEANPHGYERRYRQRLINLFHFDLARAAKA
jgi:hypothetical protein